MQDAPTKETLLLALAKFIMTDVRPAVSDSRLSFRLLIAANLAGIVAQECAGEDEQNRAEIARLAALFPELAELQKEVPPRAAQVRAMADGNAKLAKDIAAGALDVTPGGPTFAHVKQTLIEKLQIDNPRFDARRDLP
jgi:uncharacterized protein YlxW (UPF0749 family)